MTQHAGFLPGRVVAGETIFISAANATADYGGTDISFAGISPSTHTLSYSFSAPTPITVSAAANGDKTGWTLTVTAAQTLLWKAGMVRFVGMAVEVGAAGKTYCVDQGSISVDPSPLAVSAFAAALTSVDAAIASYATNPESSISIGETSINYNSIDDLLKLRQYIVWLVAQDTGGRIKRIIRTRFT